MLLAFNLLDWIQFLAHSPRHTDFFLYWLAARIGWTQGWGQIYKPEVFLPAVQASSGRTLPFLNPPPVTWLVSPLAWLPFSVALAIWSAVLLAAFAVMVRLAAPGQKLVRLAYVLSAAGLYIFFMNLRLGQVTWLVLAAVALCCWFMRERRPLLAGLVLSALILKPQLATLVPLTLLAARHYRVVVGFVIGFIPLSVLSLAAIGAGGVHEFLRASGIAHAMVGARQVTVLSVTGSLPLAIIGGGAALLAALTIGVWSAGRGPELPIAAGIVGSLLVSPYLNGLDLAALVLAGWLLIRVGVPRWLWLLLLAVYLDLMLYVFTGSAITVVTEAALLLGLAALARGSRELVTVR